MLDVLDALLEAHRAGQPVAIGTVVSTFSSAPRPPGAAMLVRADGTVVGSVSGGCVEGAVYEAAQQAMADGRPSLHHFGVADSDAIEVGLTCGGQIEIFVQPITVDGFPALDELAAAVKDDRPVALATVIAHPDAGRVGARMVVTADEVLGTLGGERVDDAVGDDARGMLASGRTGTIEYGEHGERLGVGMRVFVNSCQPAPRMLVFGSIDFASAMARLGGYLGYRVTVCDARGVFATEARFPGAEVVVSWPHRYLTAEVDAGRIDDRTVITVLTHDPKFDVPLLEVALRLDVAYVGAMGSRRTHDDRLARLRGAGLTDAELAHLASPIGLDLGARTPEETAISIAAEIIASRWTGTGLPLRRTEGRIHHDP